MKARAQAQADNRRLLPETVAEIKAAGLFRVLQPKRWGGYEMDPIVFADVQMALGNKSTAVETWKKGIEYVGTSKREQQRKAEVEKKLKANK